MKKYSVKLLTLLTAVVLLASCSDFLDKSGTGSLPADQIKSLKDAEKVVNGFYVQMKWNDYYGTNLMVLGENRGDDLRPLRESGGYSAIYNYIFGPTQNSYSAVWAKAYNVIMNTNVFLQDVWENIPAVSAADIATKNDLKGQALAVRAFCHFDVAKVYGYPYQKDNGASLGAVVNEEVVSLGEQKARSTVAETYVSIIKDLEDALPLLSKSKHPGNFNYWGVKGLLARVYLYQGDYENAFKHADEVLTDASNPYMLTTNASYVSSWENGDSPETMLELKISPDSGLDNNGGVDSWYYIMWHGEGFAAGNLVPTDAWFAVIDEDPNDVRQDLIETKVDATTTPPTSYRWLAKFRGNSGEGDFKRNHPMVIRLSEVYLIAAEAALMKSSKNQGKADTYLHTIRKRANASATQLTATVDLVLKERRKELIGEGHRYYDLGRLGLMVDRSGSDNQIEMGNNYVIVDPWNRSGTQYQVILPLSSDQRTVNPAALQNPGYPD